MSSPNGKKVLVTGSAGFIAGYLIAELLDRGYAVTGVDNFSKYGRTAKSYDGHPRFSFREGDCKDPALVRELVADCDHFVAGAARIGGISYFHEYAYDLLADNERILAASFDAAIWACKERKLEKITVLSSSMVFENATVFPTPEGHQLQCPPPSSTYGFQKLACEYFTRGAYEQYKLPYTIVRPFNCVGIGEKRALGGKAIFSGNVQLAMSHVVPDLVQKILKGQDPLHILGDGNQVRHYTYGGDLAKGIVACIEHPKALNQDFNVSTAESTTVLDLAKAIWQIVHKGSRPFRTISDKPFEYDVQRRVPDVRKAKELLGFEATTSLSAMLEEVIPWIQKEISEGTI
jgi:nucleoside-diphosphate-sugar epimerase